MHWEPLRRKLKSETNFGLFFRVGLLGILMSAAFGIAYLALLLLPLPAVDPEQLFAVFLATAIPMGASIVVGERPPGDDWIPLRLGLATFCRTGLPIFCVGVITLISKKQFEPALLGFLVFFYILGILAVVWISVYRLSNMSVGSDKNDEDERAPIT